MPWAVKFKVDVPAAEESRMLEHDCNRQVYLGVMLKLQIQEDSRLHLNGQ